MHPENRQDPTRMTRRQVLQAGLTGLAVAAFAETPGPAAEDEEDGGWIDAHSHIWSRDVERFPLAAGRSVDELDPPSFTAEELLRVCKPEGVRRVVLIQHHPYHGWDNSYLIHAAAQHPQRFRIVGMIDDQSPRPDEQMRRLLKDRVTGFRITPWIRGREHWLEGDGMAAMWRCAAETRQPMCCLIDPADLPAVDRMCERHPDTPVVIDHLARIGVDGTIRDDDVRRLCDLSRHKHTHVKVSAFYALGAKQPPYLDLVPMIRSVVEAYGPERLMWASDSPYQVQGEHTYKASIALVRDRLDFLTREERERLLGKTAESVYFFDA